MTLLKSPFRFFLNQFLRSELSLSQVSIYGSGVTVYKVGDFPTIQMHIPQIKESLFVDSSIANWVTHLYNRTGKPSERSGIEGAKSILRIVNVYWDRMERK